MQIGIDSFAAAISDGASRPFRLTIVYTINECKRNSKNMNVLVG
jgi:hypothetical protein